MYVKDLCEAKACGDCAILESITVFWSFSSEEGRNVTCFYSFLPETGVTSCFFCFTEIRSGGRGSKEGSLRQLPLYDTPYEPSENGGDSDPELLRCPRESRLPQDDERPPEEYDQPWEWKKERISKAFAGTHLRWGVLKLFAVNYEEKLLTIVP